MTRPPADFLRRGIRGRDAMCINLLPTPNRADRMSKFYAPLATNRSFRIHLAEQWLMTI